MAWEPSSFGYFDANILIKSSFLKKTISLGSAWLNFSKMWFDRMARRQVMHKKNSYLPGNRFLIKFHFIEENRERTIFTKLKCNNFFVEFNSSNCSVSLGVIGSADKAPLKRVVLGSWVWFDVTWSLWDIEATLTSIVFNNWLSLKWTS